MNGIRITWADVVAWESRNYPLDDAETSAIFAMDAAYRAGSAREG